MATRKNWLGELIRGSFSNLNGPTLSTHEQVVSALSNSFGSAVVDPAARKDTGVDIVLRKENEVVMIEVKTGNPNMPLPASAVAHMRILAQEVKRVFDPKSLYSVVLTNYRVPQDEKEELKHNGIHLFEMNSMDDLPVVIQQLAQETSIQVNPIKSDPALLSS